MVEQDIPPDSPENLRQPKPLPSIPKRVERHIQGRIVAGLLEMAPLIVTVLVVLFIVGYADLVRDLPFISGQPWDFRGLGLIIIIVAAYLVGLTIATPPGRKVMHLKDVVLGNIPVVGPYSESPSRRSRRSPGSSTSAASFSWSGREKEWWRWAS